MNPENRGEHIGLRHSLLWRKSMFADRNMDGSPNSPRCQQDLAATGLTWRNRSTGIKTHSSMHQTTGRLPQKSAREREVDSLLAEERKFSDSKRGMLRSIRPHAKSVEGSNDLVEGMRRLRQMDLLTGKEMNHVKYPGIIKVEHVYNDYHLQTANPGYSRNYQGKFYTK